MMSLPVNLEYTALLILAGALWLALGIDRVLGEPPVRWHPVVWMGHYLGWAGRYIAPVRRIATPQEKPDYQRLVLGALAWCAGTAFIWFAVWWLQYAVLMLPVALAVLLLGLLLKPLLSWRMLRREVLAVEAALVESLAAGRAQLARLVSRDVSGLSEMEVRESAIESLAENLNDSVVAPVFWFMLLGLPGAAVYRFANTADAMWGYRGVHQGREWEWAGKWAARADDVLSWLPARITALLLAVVAGGIRLRTLRKEARRTPSPNSGWPMAAMALALGVALRKPGVYVLHAAGRAPAAEDSVRAAVYASKVVAALLFIASFASLLTAFLAKEIGL